MFPTSSDMQRHIVKSVHVCVANDKANAFISWPSRTDEACAAAPCSARPRLIRSLAKDRGGTQGTDREQREHDVKREREKKGKNQEEETLSSLELAQSMTCSTRDRA